MPSYSFSQLKKVVFDTEKCAECKIVYLEGVPVRLYEDEEVDFAVTLIKNDKLTVASFLFHNKKKESLEISSSNIALYNWKNIEDFDAQKTVEVKKIDPEKAAKKMKGNNFFKNFLTGMAGGLATNTTETNVVGTVSDDQGNVAVVSGTATTTTSDTSAQQRSAEIIRERNEQSRSIGEAVLESAFKRNTIFYNQTVGGNIFFEKVSGIQQMIIVFNDTKFIIPFAVK